jgi:cytochrome b561
MFFLIALQWICARIPWPADLFHVVPVFLSAVLCFVVVFAAQLLLIHHIERRDAFRRGQDRHR